MNRHMVLEEKVHHQFKDEFIIISIASPELRDYTIPDCEKLMDIHYSVFHDIDSDGNVKGAIVPVDMNNLILFNDDMAQDIVDFALKWKDKVKFIIVHCDAGLSRSAGAALALSEILNENVRMPQMFVRSLTGGLSLFNRFIRRKLLNIHYSTVSG